MHLRPWSEVLAAHRGRDVPWLVQPAALRTTTAHRATSYGELHDLGLRVARGLAQLGVAKGDRVVVVADSTPSTCIAILGALIGGAVVVPVAPPPLGGSDVALGIEAVVMDCGARVVVAESAPSVRALVPPGVRVESFAGLCEARRDAPALPACSPGDLALIQYTSGTTSRPRGVCLTHGNLLHNVQRLGEFCDVGPDDVGVTWLPLFHDMGLIASLLFTTYWGVPLVLLSPRSFMARPDSWLWAISRFGAAFSAAPNSAYHLCATRTPDRRLAGLDLSSWRFAFNGAETVQPSTIERFTSRFEPLGFSRESMCPVYGLAENTVAASLPPGRTPPVVEWVDADALEKNGSAVPPGDGGRRGVVCVGQSLTGQELRIVDPDTGRPVADRCVGEVQLRGPCTTTGYWGLPRSSQPLTDDGWLRTGDRAFVVGRDLYVIGRYKHVVKRMGRTLDCAQIESSVREVAGLGLGAVAAFGVGDDAGGAERLVVLAEIARRSPEHREAAKTILFGHLRSALSVTPDELMLVPPNTIPRTTSGKVRHTDARGVYLAERRRPSV